MKPRHTAALALVGWYLMTAPAFYKPDFLTPPPPLSRWFINQSFDTAEECEKIRLRNLEKKFGDQSGLQALAWACVASDDPRLKQTP